MYRTMAAAISEYWFDHGALPQAISIIVQPKLHISQDLP